MNGELQIKDKECRLNFPVTISGTNSTQHNEQAVHHWRRADKCQSGMWWKECDNINTFTQYDPAY